MIEFEVCSSCTCFLLPQEYHRNHFVAHSANPRIEDITSILMAPVLFSIENLFLALIYYVRLDEKKLTVFQSPTFVVGLQVCISLAHLSLYPSLVWLDLRLFH